MIRQDKIGWDRTGHDMIGGRGQDRIRQDKIKLDSTGQDKKGQDSMG